MGQSGVSMEQIVRFSPKSAGGTVNSCPFPVGFGGFFLTDPNSIYAGTTWEQKKDVFILASGDTYTAGSTGGEAQHTLTKAELPNQVVLNRAPTKAIQIPAVKREVVDVASSKWVFGSIFDFALAESLGATGVPHNNMPPFYSMPFWVRTA